MSLADATTRNQSRRLFWRDEKGKQVTFIIITQDERRHMHEYQILAIQNLFYQYQWTNLFQIFLGEVFQIPLGEGNVSGNDLKKNETMINQPE